MSGLALSVDGASGSFPEPEVISSWMRALDLLAMVPGRSAAPPASDSLRAAMLPVRQVAVRNAYTKRLRSDEDVRGAFFCGSDETATRRAQHLAMGGIEEARQLGARWLIVELGPLPRSTSDPDWSRAEVGELRDGVERHVEGMLDRVSRALYEVGRVEPDVGIAVATPASPCEMPTPAMLEMLVGDLGRRRIGYWHDTGRARALAHRGMYSEETWLDRLGPCCVGVDLTDCMGEHAGLPAGSGEVDFAGLRDGLPSAVIRVLRAEPFVGPGPLAGAARFLRELGY